MNSGVERRMGPPILRHAIDAATHLKWKDHPMVSSISGMERFLVKCTVSPTAFDELPMKAVDQRNALIVDVCRASYRGNPELGTVIAAIGESLKKDRLFRMAPDQYPVWATAIERGADVVQRRPGDLCAVNHPN